MKKYVNSTMISGIAATALLTAIAPASFALDYYSYAGVAGGVESLTIKSDANYEYGSAITSPDSSASDSHSAIGATGELYLGLATQPMGRFYLGTELNVSGMTGSASTVFEDPNVGTAYAGGDSAYDTQVSYALGISVLPGFVLSDKTLLYSRVAYELVGFKNTVNDDNVNPASAGISKSAPAFRLGLGAERFITSSLSLRVEGDYWHANTVNNSFKYTPPPVGDTYSTESNIDYHTDLITGLVGLTYHFGAQSDTTSK